MIEILTKDNFLNVVFNYEQHNEWKYQGRLPCLIDFHDDSCPPCRALFPVVDELSRSYHDRVLFYKVDITKEPALARELGVKNLPTIVLCPMNDKPVVFAGAAAKDKLRDAIERELLGAVHQPNDEQ